MKFLELSEGRCSQDSLFIRRPDVLPAYVEERMNRNLSDITLCPDRSLLCFFHDGMIRKTPLSSVPDESGAVRKVLHNPALFRSGTLTAGGYAVTFNNSIDIPAGILRSCGTLIPLCEDDFLAWLSDTVMDTSQACGLLGCSRQNLAYMSASGQLSPLRKDVKGNLYTEGSLLKTRW